MIEKLRNDMLKLNNLIDELTYEDSRWLKWRLLTVKRDLEDKIKLEEDKQNQDDNIVLPSWVNYGEHDLIVHNGITYALTKFKKDKDDSFNLSSYAFIPHKDGYCSFSLNFLGADKYGDRIYSYNYFYATRNTDWSYLSKDYGKGNRYPEKYEEHVRFMIDEFNKLPEVNGSFNPFNRESR